MAHSDLEGNKYEWPKDWHTIKLDFKEMFGMSILDFFCPFMSWCEGRCVIDLVKFDDMLHEKFGEYEDRGLSMSDIVKHHYGEKALNLINQLI